MENSFFSLLKLSWCNTPWLCHGDNQLKEFSLLKNSKFMQKLDTIKKHLSKLLVGNVLLKLI